MKTLMQVNPPAISDLDASVVRISAQLSYVTTLFQESQRQLAEAQTKVEALTLALNEAGSAGEETRAE